MGKHAERMRAASVISECVAVGLFGGKAFPFVQPVRRFECRRTAFAEGCVRLWFGFDRRNADKPHQRLHDFIAVSGKIRIDLCELGFGKFHIKSSFLTKRRRKNAAFREIISSF